MIQTHSMILWANPVKEDFKEIVEKAYRLLDALVEFGPELSPNYLPAYSKKATKPFTLNYESLEEQIKKGVNKEGNTTFPDLGYHIGFFSSLNDDDSAGINLHLGITNSNFSNTYVVDLPHSLNVMDEDIGAKLIKLFKTSVAIFNPYYGFMNNSATLDRYTTLYKNDMPTTVHWVNYFGEDLVRKITLRRLSEIPSYSLEKIDEKGYMLILQKKPIDDNSVEEVRIQSEINKKLGLTD